MCSLRERGWDQRTPLSEGWANNWNSVSVLVPGILLAQSAVKTRIIYTFLTPLTRLKTPGIDGVFPAEISVLAQVADAKVSVVEEER